MACVQPLWVQGATIMDMKGGLFSRDPVPSGVQRDPPHTCLRNTYMSCYLESWLVMDHNNPYAAAG